MEDKPETQTTIVITVTWCADDLEQYAPQWDAKNRMAFLRKYEHAMTEASIDAGEKVILYYLREETPESLADE